MGERHVELGALAPIHATLRIHVAPDHRVERASCCLFVDPGQEVEEPGSVDHHVVVDSKHEGGARARLRRPLEYHHGLEGQIRVRVDKVLLQQVLVGGELVARQPIHRLVATQANGEHHSEIGRVGRGSGSPRLPNHLTPVEVVRRDEHHGQ